MIERRVAEVSVFVGKLLVLGLVLIVKRQAAIESMTVMLVEELFVVWVEGLVWKSWGEKQVLMDHHRDHLDVIAFLW